MTPMEPIPETLAAVGELDPADEGRLLEQLQGLGELARAIVPDLVGLSLARLAENVTLTLVATAEEIAVLDAIQYAAGGPCVDSAHAAQRREFAHDDVLSEERWQLFAEATAARTVRSTLTLPVLDGRRTVGTVNLYAASRRAFVGHHEQLAEIFQAWAEGAIVNADLAFATRSEAEAAPQRVRDLRAVDVASGILAEEHGLRIDEARAKLDDAARRAGVSVSQLAHEIVGLRDGRDTGE